jgi:hypothetical protein
MTNCLELVIGFFISPSKIQWNNPGVDFAKKRIANFLSAHLFLAATSAFRLLRSITNSNADYSQRSSELQLIV